MYDYLIIGSGLYGSILARELTDVGKKCLVIEKRNHIGGNCFTEKIEGIDVHKYGAHIFHTSNKEVWNYMCQYTKFNNYRHHVIANYQNEIYSLPFNMFTFNKLWGVSTPEQAVDKIQSQLLNIEPKNLEEQALSTIGFEIYEKFIKGYTEKQWMKKCVDLPKEILKRIPIRLTYDNNYFFDPYQGIPEQGYTEIFNKLLFNIEVRLNTDYFDNREYFDSISKKIIYTGPIDKFFNYKFGSLEYRPLRFESKILNTENFQGHSVINYTDSKIPYTRIIEHKHFNLKKTENTIITYEYPIDWDIKQEPYYPINDIENQKLYQMYNELSKTSEKTIFGGRLAEYKYYDMDRVVDSALKKIKELDIDL